MFMITSRNVAPRRQALDVWARRSCTLVVAAVAAYASYQHQHEFALRGGADSTTAVLWPLSVDGLLVLASIGLLSPRGHPGRRSRWALWTSFLLGIVLSLAANVAAAPTLAWQSVLVAGWPPVSVLLAVELLTRRISGRDVPENTRDSGETESETAETSIDLFRRVTAEQIMWSHYQRESSHGRVPSGAELDRVGTNNYGHAVLRQWRRHGRLAVVDGSEPKTAVVSP